MPPPDESMSDDDFRALCGYLDGPLNYDGLLGLLHAIALAPSMIPPSSWLEVVWPNGLGDLTEAEAENAIRLVMRQYNEVMSAVADGQLMIPEPEDVDDCKSFAAGYTMGAALDHEWINHDDRWTFAAPFAFLAGQHDLVPEDLLQKLQADRDAESSLLKQMAAILYATQESFSEAPQTQLERTSAVPHPSAPKVGRNEPCPCGSGKKHKRCCGAPNRTAATLQ